MAQEQDRRRAKPAPQGFEIRIPAQAEELRTVRHALGTWLAAYGAPSEVEAEVEFAVHEAAANAVEHAYVHGAGDVIVRANSRDDSLIVVVQDEGGWRPPGRTDQRGRGLILMRGLMDYVEIVPGPHGTRVTLRRQVARRR